MNDGFKCRCSKCGKEENYPDMTKAFLDGWNIGFNATCWDCQKQYNPKSDDVPTTNVG